MNTITPLSALTMDTKDLLKKELLGIVEYQERRELNAELNADAYELLTAPAQLSHLVLMSDRQWVDQERQLIAQLCARYGVTSPGMHNNHFSAELGEFRLRWERHTEYSTYTIYHLAPFEIPFDQSAIRLVPGDWLASLPGEVLVAIHIALDDRSRPKRSLTELVGLFSSNNVIGSKVAAGSASVWSDNQIHRDGFGRILIHDENLRSRQVGRLVQRLLEIETYRMLAMLPVPAIRQMIPQLARFDQRLAGLIASNIELASIEDEQRLLDGLTQLASDIERISAQTSHRFNASRVYYDIVKLRITELREERIEGLQMLQEFMEQHLSSAMGTCELVHSKLETLSLRVARASALLRTRVDISMEAQIRDLLKSMDSRAHMQLRLQETVEGLSVVVLSYYLLGILGHGLKAYKAAGLDINVDLVIGMAIPVVVIGVFVIIRGLRWMVSKVYRDKE
ncbi:MAG: DUF3422 domain-containing protein [Nitrosomonas sp.]|nr:DUF3422 domain-containing protein [Nitrosomonas sp.]MDP1950873.1 DUF3422 domain-containing protein [Nitrosomonas sp.]